MLLMALLLPAFDHTVDDAFISYRYARNLTSGQGLVFNPGQRVEGYTNFLWTLVLAGGIRLGLAPDAVAKALGALSGLGIVAATFLLARTLRPSGQPPYLATWLVATSAPILSFSVSGMETSAFVALVVLGTALMLREEGSHARMPWSAMVFGASALLRPEAAMYMVVVSIALGPAAFSRRNLLRLAIFAAPVIAHELWRHSYYSAWVPNTLLAKTAGLDSQLGRGLRYLRGYAGSSQGVLVLSIVGLALLTARRTKSGAAVVMSALATVVYVVLVGGDWMPNLRFFAVLEPFVCVAAAHALTTVAASLTLPRRELTLVVGLALAFLAIDRYRTVARSIEYFEMDRAVTNALYEPTARWLSRQRPGLIAVGDIGRIGWASDFPVLDLFGLVDPLIARLPGVGGEKFGQRFADHVYESDPDYIVVRSRNGSCADRRRPAFARLMGDIRFREYSEAVRFRFGDEVLCTYVGTGLRTAGDR